MEEQLAVITDKIDALQKSVNRLDQDMEIDRKGFEQIRITVAALEAQIDELRKNLNRLVSKTQDRVADVIAPLQEQIEQHPVVEYTRKPFWKFWK